MKDRCFYLGVSWKLLRDEAGNLRRFEDVMELRRDISVIFSTLPRATMGSERGSVMVFQVYLTRQE
jgi:hypothetical protein